MEFDKGWVNTSIWIVCIFLPIGFAFFCPYCLLGVTFFSSFFVRDVRFFVSMAISLSLFAVLEWKTIKGLLVLYEDVKKLSSDT